MKTQADKLTGAAMAVYGYCRVSTQRQVDQGESLDQQQRQLRGYVASGEEPMELTEIFIEEGVSGSVPFAERPMGRQLMAKLAPGDVVIATKLDRMFRSSLDALNVVEALKERGVKLHLIDLRGDIVGNGLSRLFFTIVSAFAEVERDRIRERISDVKAHQKEQGRYLGGKVPFGYRVGEDGQLVPQSEEQDAIEAMRQMRADGASLRTIAAAMATKGIRLSHEGVSGVLKGR